MKHETRASNRSRQVAPPGFTRVGNQRAATATLRRARLATNRPGRGAGAGKLLDPPLKLARPRTGAARSRCQLRNRALNGGAAGGLLARAVRKSADTRKPERALCPNAGPIPGPRYEQMKRPWLILLAGIAAGLLAYGSFYY